MPSLWFSPICDDILKRFLIWIATYQVGEIHSTREWVSPQDGSVQDKPTKYAHRVPWKEMELRYLTRILRDSNPQSHLTADFEEVLKLWKFGQLTTGGYRIMTLAFYKEDLEDVVKMLLKAKGIASDSIQDAAVPGKELFQL